MRPEVAGEADSGKETPPTCGTEVGRGSIVGVGSSGLLLLAFLLGLVEAPLFCCASSCCDGTAPGGMIGCECLPVLSVDIEVFKRNLQAVLEAFLLPSNFALSMGEFTIEELLWDTVVSHTGDMARPPQLSLAHDSDDAGDVRLLQNPSVGDFVLPADVQEVAETSEVEVVDLPFMSSVCSPRFAAIE